MKKFPKPWFRPKRGVWYVTFGGQQINLGPDEGQAFDRYAKLLAEPKKREVPSDSFAAIADAFLAWVQRHRSPETYGWYQYRLERFCKKYPELLAPDVRPFHVTDWVDCYELSVTSRRNYLRTVKRCMKWAKRQGHLDTNPIADLEVPAGESKEVNLTQADIDLLLSMIRDESLRDLVVVTIETGCRPQESLRVEARHFDSAHQRWVFPKSESKNKKRSRVVYLTDTAAEIVVRLVRRYPGGRLFRSRTGAWTTSAVNCAFVRIQIRIGKRLMKERGLAIKAEEIKRMIPMLKQTRTVKGEIVNKTDNDLWQEAKRKLTYRLACTLAPKWSLYALRHAWATNALQRGIDPLTVAILMGHSDPSMLSKVYQHLSLNPKHMLESAKRAAG